LRSSGKLTLDKDTLRKVKQRIEEDEQSVIEMYYSNMEQVMKSQNPDQPIDESSVMKPFSSSRPGTTTKSTIKFSKLSMA
jgi:hypothetical protein